MLGRPIQVNNVELGIIGVLPPGFVGLEVDHGVDIYTPFDTVLLATAARRQLAGFLLGRLRPGVTFEAAEAELRARWPAVLDATLPATLPPSELANFRDSNVRLERMGTGRSAVRTRYVRALTLILGLTAMLLVLACVNLGGLLLARLTGRSGELSVRLALGGTRWRIAQQMLMESLLLACGGAVLAVPLAYAIVSVLVAMLPTSNLPNTMSFTPDAGVLAALAAMALLTGATMTALPLWVAMRRRAGSHATWDRTIAGANTRWGRVLLVAQVAVSVVLLVGAALLTRSLYLLQHNDLGIRSAGIVTVRTLPLPGAANNQRNSLSDFNLYSRTDCRAAWCPRRRVRASLSSRCRVRWRADPVRRRRADGAVDVERLRLVGVLLDARHSAAGRPIVHDRPTTRHGNRWSWSARAWRARCRPTAT